MILCLQLFRQYLEVNKDTIDIIQMIETKIILNGSQEVEVRTHDNILRQFIESTLKSKEIKIRTIILSGAYL